MPKQYKVLEGIHIDGGKTFTKGQMVVSSRELDQMFKGKFVFVKDISDPVPAPYVPPVAPVTTPKRVENVEPEEEEAEEEAAPVRKAPQVQQHQPALKKPFKR